MSSYEDSVINVILGYSVNPDYNIAKNEWVYAGEVIDHGPLRDQQVAVHCTVCGHAIRYGFMLTNKYNHRRLEVGSECLTNFGNISYSKADHDLKKLKQKQEREAIDLMLGSYWEIQRAFPNYFKKKYGISNIHGMWLDDFPNGGREMALNEYNEVLKRIRLLDTLIRDRSPRAIELLLEEAGRSGVRIDPDAIPAFMMIMKVPKSQKRTVSKRKPTNTRNDFPAWHEKTSKKEEDDWVKFVAKMKKNQK